MPCSTRSSTSICPDATEVTNRVSNPMYVNPVEGPLISQFPMLPDEVNKLIPLFNPNETTSNLWIEEIENLKRLHFWTNQTTLRHAVIRLGEVPRLWYEAVRGEISSWDDFKNELKKGFPNQIDEADVHFRLLNRFKKPDEDYENYVYDIIRIGQKANLSESALVKYVIQDSG